MNLLRTAAGGFLAACGVVVQAQEPDTRVPDNNIPVFEERSLLGGGGRLTIEPSITYSHNSSTLVAVEGYTVIPALVVGLINVSQVQRDTFISALTLRYAFNNRFQMSVRVPYVYTEETIRERQAFDGSPVDILNNSSGDGLGDVEGSIQFQFNVQRPPYFTGSLRVKSHTGEHPYQIKRRRLTDQNGKDLGFVFAEQPTGSGFWAIQPAISMVYPSDPAVVYWSLSYLWNIKREMGYENGGTINPGDAVGVSFGIGFAVNERTSFSLGYDHSNIHDTQIEHNPSKIESQFKRFQVGSLLLGLNHTLSPGVHFNLSLGVGVTEQAPDVQLTLRTPISWGF